MPIIAALLFTGVLAVIIPKLKARTIHGSLSSASRVAQSPELYRIFAMVLQTMMLALRIALRLSVGTVIKVIAVIQLGMLSATREATGEQPRNLSETESTSNINIVSDSADKLSTTRNTAYNLMIAFLWTLKQTSRFVYTVWQSVDEEVKSWEAQARNGRAQGGNAEGQSPTTDLVTPSAQLHSTLTTEGLMSITADTYEDPETGLVTIVLDLPGVRNEDVSVDLRGQQLEVSAERPPRRVDALIRPGVSERPVGKFVRLFQDLPIGLKLDEIKASMDLGVLTLTYPSEPSVELSSSVVIT